MTIEQREILCGVYRGRPPRMLAHDCVVDDAGVVVRVVCGRADPGSMADRGGQSGAPLCLYCQAKRARRDFERRERVDDWR